MLITRICWKCWQLAPDHLHARCRPDPALCGEVLGVSSRFLLILSSTQQQALALYWVVVATSQPWELPGIRASRSGGMESAAKAWVEHHQKTPKPSSDPGHSGLHPAIFLIAVSKVKHLFSLHYLTPHPFKLEKGLLLPFPSSSIDSLLPPPLTSGASGVVVDARSAKHINTCLNSSLSKAFA